jgi:hypothetical protein
MDIVPHVGIGKVRLGMSQEEAERLRGPSMGLGYVGNPPTVAFIEVRDAFYRGIDLCYDPADEVLAAIVKLEGLNPADYPPGKHSYKFPHLNLVLWRGEVSDEPDEQGYTFQSASIHVPGYYDQAQ